jgi:hypothetical protein
MVKYAPLPGKQKESASWPDSTFENEMGWLACNKFSAGHTTTEPYLSADLDGSAINGDSEARKSGVVFTKTTVCLKGHGVGSVCYTAKHSRCYRFQTNVMPAWAAYATRAHATNVINARNIGDYSDCHPLVAAAAAVAVAGN